MTCCHHLSWDTENSFHPRRMHHFPFQSLISCEKSVLNSFTLWFCWFLIVLINEIIHFSLFSVWLLSHNKMFLRFIHVYAYLIAHLSTCWVLIPLFKYTIDFFLRTFTLVLIHLYKSLIKVRWWDFIS